MAQSQRLTEEFIAALCPENVRRFDATPDLERRLQQLRARIAQAWPSPWCSDVEVVKALAARIAVDGPGTEPEQLHVEDLYLVLGCASGSSEAIASFEMHF